MRRAVLVAASEFKDAQSFPPLRFPAQDAARLREVLLDPELCFFDEAELVSNGTASMAVRALERFARASEPDDLLLFYYSGHGQLDRDGTLALAMPDSERDYLSTTSLISDELKRLFRMSRARHKIMILDCCYSGAASDAQFKGSLNDSITALAQQISGSFLLTASSRSEPAFESDTLQGGALTSCLIEGIATGAAAPPQASSITLAQLASYVRKKVPGFGAQQPQSWDLGGIGDLSLAKKPSRFDTRWARRARHKLTLWVKSERIDEDMADDMGRAIRNRQDSACSGRIELIDRWLESPMAASLFAREWDRTAGGDGAEAEAEPAAGPGRTEERPDPAPEAPVATPDPEPSERPPETRPGEAARFEAGEPAKAGTSGTGAATPATDRLQGLLRPTTGGGGGASGPTEPGPAEGGWAKWVLGIALLILLLYVLLSELGIVRGEDFAPNSTAINFTEDPLMGSNAALDVDASDGTADWNGAGSLATDNALDSVGDGNVSPGTANTTGM